eukprot:TRINITY_DN109_c0_g2_i2.p1 TRINITY_DN109_c0_g2~~TRINITY_DN109_c0_g2_i2.p1  ORF type:complete len:959 (-),score=361.32 TRINITY_DN109_c0_g2_i2:266-3142(-)
MEKSRSEQAFVSEFLSFFCVVEPIGRLNSVAQLLLKLTCPGVPDIYQGCELPAFSLVDPDNRRPADYTLRQTLLASLPQKGLDSDVASTPEGKLFLTRSVLNFRRDNPEFFSEGRYVPLKVNGVRANHVIAFARQLEREEVITVVSRFHSMLGVGWDNTEIRLPNIARVEAEYVDLLTNSTVRTRDVGGELVLMAAELFMVNKSAAFLVPKHTLVPAPSAVSSPPMLSATPQRAVLSRPVAAILRARMARLQEQKLQCNIAIGFERHEVGIGEQFDPKAYTMDIRKGTPYPLGATILQFGEERGVNFAVYCPEEPDAPKEYLKLCLFLTESETKPFVTLTMNRDTFCTGDVWHCLVLHLPSYFCYGYALNDDPFINADPYARVLNSRKKWGAPDPASNVIRRCVVNQEPPFFDWDGDGPLGIDLHELVIYEMHVRGFTAHPSSQTKFPGTYLGVIEKIPQLIELGVNAVELLPVFEFDELYCDTKNPFTGEKLKNYWGYSSESFFFPMNRYAFHDEAQVSSHTAILQFKEMVKALHRAGIEVILDVVFNHTGGFSFQNLVKETYYITSQGSHTNYSGCGNTLNCNHPVVIDFIVDCLKYWVEEMHVDGFRFDEAPILGRADNGTPYDIAPLLVAISNEPALSKTKLIAEAWDAGGLYQIGMFAHQHFWCEWNGKFRDGVRNFIKGTSAHDARDFGTRLAGSPDIYGALSPSHSINFITCHDGQTLMDLVSYAGKHNEANGEGNRDGINDNNSWNCGAEGATNDAGINVLRQKQIRNFVVALFISRGVPMINMGDEYAHTKQGNNNTWCQDNELTWFNWDKMQVDPVGKAFYRFFRGMVQFRASNDVLFENDFLRSDIITWHGVRLNSPNWDNPDNRMVAFHLKQGDDFIYVCFNPSHYATDVEIPRVDKAWHRIVNTALSSPDDFTEEADSKPAEINEHGFFHMECWSCIILKTFTPK